MRHNLLRCAGTHLGEPVVAVQQAQQDLVGIQRAARRCGREHVEQPGAARVLCGSGRRADEGDGDAQ